MREIQYKTFSLNTHKKNWQLKRPNVCQFELTFRCGLRCNYCYSDCYNRPAYLKKELKTDEVKHILDKVYDAGVIWLCFTGGDPLTRKDFLDIYSYAKEKGFIITIFSNLTSLTKRIVEHLKKNPPFVIEITLNAATRNLYEKITGVEDSFDKVMRGIESVKKAKLPMKIKTQITKDNLAEIPKIRSFVKGLGLKFSPSTDLYARLNGDSAPCNLRLSPQEILSLNGKGRISDDACELLRDTKHRTPNTKARTPNTSLFRCTIGGGDGFNVDPYGRTFPCALIRKPAFNLLKVNIEYALNELLSLVRERRFTVDSKCSGCGLRESCRWCPGRAYVERGDMETPVEYYCELANKTAQRGRMLS
ncbi:MAG: radical SAM protein [Candidatus Omnitrophica bacterium]|nr:radical SAM protein [Candidatus Omnitrophota bacterium]